MPKRETLAFFKFSRRQLRAAKSRQRERERHGLSLYRIPAKNEHLIDYLVTRGRLRDNEAEAPFRLA